LAFRSYEDLRVFQAAMRLSDLVWKVVTSWDSFERIALGTQLVTAADSIGANIAEGAGRGTNKENQRFIRIARGSLYELKCRLQRANARGLIAESAVNEVLTLMEELGPSLNAYLRSFSDRST
jgi:four helix bundle protein